MHCGRIIFLHYFSVSVFPEQLSLLYWKFSFAILACEYVLLTKTKCSPGISDNVWYFGPIDFGRYQCIDHISVLNNMVALAISRARRKQFRK